MKKLLVFSMVLVFTTVSIFAMDVSLGGKVNFNFNTLTADTGVINDKGFLFGGGIAFVGVIGINEFFAVQPEIAVNCQNGMSYSVLNESASFSFLTIDIPILAKGKLWLGPGIMSLNLGPQISFIIGDVVTKIGDSKITQSVDDANLNSFLFGIVAGLDYSLPLGPGYIVFDIRFMTDFTSLSKDNEAKKLGNRMQISPSLGYIVNLM